MGSKGRRERDCYVPEEALAAIDAPLMKADTKD